jgi:hypothetical protein
MITLKDAKKVEYVLELEFRRVLPEVRDRDWHICKVNMEKLKFTNESLLNKCRKKDLSYLATYKLPRALCIAEHAPGDTVYRVIDGYHRLADVLEHNDPCCLVIYCD